MKCGYQNPKNSRGYQCMKNPGTRQSGWDLFTHYIPLMTPVVYFDYNIRIHFAVCYHVLLIVTSVQWNF